MSDFECRHEDSYLAELKDALSKGFASSCQTFHGFPVTNVTREIGPLGTETLITIRAREDVTLGNHFISRPLAPMQMPKPEKVIVHYPATVVYWDDGTKTVVRCQKGDLFSRRTGLLVAMAKRAYGNSPRFNDVLNAFDESEGASEDD